MDTIKVRIKGGKIIGNGPEGLPEGTELELRLADPEQEMSREGLAALNASLERGWDAIQQGKTVPFRTLFGFPPL